MILGAGASRGASFADATRQVLPPLDADFFEQAQRIDESAFKGAGREVIDFVRDEYGTTQMPTLETLFTQAQGYEQFVRQFHSKPGPKPVRYKKQLGYLLELIPRVFEAALAEQECTWHDRIAYAMRKGDTIISFNYDVLIDEALTRLAAGIWKADPGYGVSIADGSSGWSAQRKPGAFPRKEYLRLLKPHGSLNWQLEQNGDPSLRLTDDPYGAVAAKGNIIPPTWDKAILQEWPWKPIWKAASQMLQRTRCLIVVGYSVPQTDLMSQALIRSSLIGGNLRLIVVANPDPRARSRVIDLARGGITSNTRILEFDGLSDFAQLLDEPPREKQKRQATRRQLRAIGNRLADIEETIDDLELYDLEEIETRISEIENFDLDEIEDRAEEVDALETRISELESQVEDLEG
ncbi:MAG TPA: SIR2 family protein [Solirubrobacterales bacterium]|nr:SIR2 family protein [Solirubrobacterales bacterium]